MLPLAITLGDPAGIGPEIAAKVIAQLQPKTLLRPLLFIGNHESLVLSGKMAGCEQALDRLEFVTTPEELSSNLGLVKIGDLPHKFSFGEMRPECGQLAVRSVEIAADYCMSKKVAGMVTGPINKAAINSAGYSDDIGHQEILSRLTGSIDTATMLMTPGLRVVHLSTHKSLIAAAQYVTKDILLKKILLTAKTLERWGIRNPSIGVAALNPHGGESGLLGREEIEEISPAIEEAIKCSVNAKGPIPADSIFNRAILGEFDVVLAMYHDQGHIAIKVHNFHESTTATLGIPFVRTSVDHGTAFDIAGQGVANPLGLISAINMADALVDGKILDT